MRPRPAGPDHADPGTTNADTTCKSNAYIYSDQHTDGYCNEHCYNHTSSNRDTNGYCSVSNADSSTVSYADRDSGA